MLYLVRLSIARLPIASNRTRARSYSSRDSVQRRPLLGEDAHVVERPAPAAPGSRAARRCSSAIAEYVAFSISPCSVYAGIQDLIRLGEHLVGHDPARLASSIPRGTARSSRRADPGPSGSSLSNVELRAFGAASDVRSGTPSSSARARETRRIATWYRPWDIAMIGLLVGDPSGPAASSPPSRRAALYARSASSGWLRLYRMSPTRSWISASSAV